MAQRPTAAAFSSTCWALILGIDSPGIPSMPTLFLPEKDARELSLALTEQSGCAFPQEQVLCMVGSQATKDSVLATLSHLSSQLSDDDTLLFYFAGHGLRSEDDFILCTTSTNSHEFQPGDFLCGTDLEKALNQFSARGILLILDCCESAGFAEQAPATFRRLDKGEYRILLSASKANQPSWEFPNGGGTLFTRNLIEIVSGKQPVGNEPGLIYFSDLLRTLDERILEQQQIHHPDLPRQEPVFVGVYSRDPLIFVHRSLSLEQIRISTARYSSTYVRRKVRSLIVGALSVLLFVLITYYAILDKTQYAKAEREKLSIFNGYPEYNLPGYPKHLWTFGFGPERLLDHGKEGYILVAPLGKPVLPLIMDQMKPEWRAALLASGGKTAEARALALQIITDAEHNDYQSELYASLVFADTAQTSDIPRLKPWLQNERKDIRFAAIRALAKLEPEFLYPYAMQDLPGGNDFPHLEFVRRLEGKCSSEAAKYLSALMSIDSSHPTVSNIVDVALRLDCPLSMEDLVQAVLRPALWGRPEIADYAELKAVGDQLGERLLIMTGDRSIDFWRKNSLISTYACLSHLKCPAEFEHRLQDPDWRTQMVTALAITRHCSDTTLKTSWLKQGKSYSLQLMNKEKTLWELNVPLREKDYVIGHQLVAEFAVRNDRKDLLPVLAELPRLVFVDDHLREIILISLDALQMNDSPMWDLMDSNNLQVRRAAYELARRSSRDEVVKRLFERVGGQDDFYIEMLGRVPLSRTELGQLSVHLRGDVQHRRQAACILAMQEKPKEAYKLLTQPDDDIRSPAYDCVPYNPKASEILNEIRATDLAFPSESFSELSERIARKEMIESELARLPVGARLWRLKLMDDGFENNLGQALRWWIREQRFRLRRPAG